MNKLTKESVDAFLQGRRFKKANMEVSNTSMYLYGNRIAWLDRNKQLWISNCGWKTVTTKERLNALPNVHIIQRNYTWFLYGVEWDGKPKCIGRVN